MELLQQGEISFDAIKSDVGKIKSIIRSRDFIEIFAATFLALFCLDRLIIWSIRALQVNFMMELGMVTLILVLVFIVFKLRAAHKLIWPDDWSLLARFKCEIEKVEKQLKLRSSVLYWYLTPLGTAILIFSQGDNYLRTGSLIPDSRLSLFYFLCILFFSFIYWLNQRTVKTQLIPLLDKLKEMQAQLDEDFCD